MKACMIAVPFLMWASFTMCLYAQSAHETAKVYFDEIRSGSRVEIPNFNTGMIDAIKPYLTDTMARVRMEAREMLYRYALSSTNEEVRSDVIEQLLAAAAGVDATSTSIIIQMLQAFEKAEFTDSAKMQVREFVKAEGPYLSEWMKIAGFLELKDLMGDIRPYSQPGNQQALRWSALLSLARMGDKPAAAEVLSRARKLGVNDDVVYSIFPDLIFTRDNGVIDYIIQVLHGDADHCLSADIERETAIPCGYRIMEQLAPVIEGFPLTLDESGDANVEDYASALVTVRQWLHAKKKYNLRKERY